MSNIDELEQIADAEINRLKGLMVMQQNISFIHNLCFDVCLKDFSSPSLHGGESACLSSCFSRYHDARKVSIQTLQDKMRQSRNKG